MGSHRLCPSDSAIPMCVSQEGHPQRKGMKMEESKEVSAKEFHTFTTHILAAEFGC